VFAFCHGTLDHDRFFGGLRSVVGDKVPIIGGSAIGIITNDCLSYKGCPAGAAVFQSETLQHRVAAVGDLDKDERLAGIKLGKELSGEPEDKLLWFLSRICGCFLVLEDRQGSDIVQVPKDHSFENRMLFL